MFLRKNTGIEYIIAGLGNPGSEYDKTRHNAGFRFVDWLCDSLKLPSFRLKHMSLCVKGELGGHSVLIMKPQTYMNKSGESISDAARFYKLDPQHVIVVSDDISLAPGKMRLRKNGSAGGHNGLKSIIYRLNSDTFPRVKMGVGAPKHEDYDLADFVLGRFTKEEIPVMEDAIVKAEKAVAEIIKNGVQSAMNKYNGK